MNILVALVLLLSTPQIAAADSFLIFFNGSTTVCRPELSERGLCKPSDLTRCIVVRNQMRQPAACEATGTASFVEMETGNTKSVEDKIDIELDAGEAKTVCFDYNRNLYKLWSFQSFDKFAGSCGNKGAEQVEPVLFRLDNEKCSSGWPCNKIEVKKTSLHIDEKAKSACLNYANKNSKTQFCDLRLDVQLQSGIETSIRRQEKLFYNQEQTVCFPFDNITEGFVNIKDMGVVCRQLESCQSPEKFCDLADSLCAVETEQTLILTP